MTRPTRPDTTALLAAREVTVGYGGAPVIPSLSLEVARGDLMVVVGPNGCGKSTLLKTLARVHRPSAGSIELDGQDVHRMRGRAVALGVLREHHRLAQDDQPGGEAGRLVEVVEVILLDEPTTFLDIAHQYEPSSAPISWR